MKRLYGALGFLFLSLLFIQCQKGLNNYGGPDPDPNPHINTVDPAPITANLQGNVFDENGSPAPGATVTVGTKTTTTDSKGYFRINSASLDENTSLVVIEKAGYFKGIRVFAATSGTNQVTVKLIKKSLAGTVNSASGGDATLSNGSKISLPANGVVNASTGAAYTGDIKVYAAYINPTANDINQTIPGSFAANDKNGSRVMLQSYGMMAVQLESTAGEKLQIKDGMTASLTTAIPAASLSSAPATIAMWSVDENTGLWKEEGTGTKNGNNYVGNVKHFSFWNYDQPINAVRLDMTLLAPDTTPIVHALVKITRTSMTAGAVYTYGITDTLGQVGGMVPANESLLLEVFDPCYNVVYSQTIPALTQNTDLGNLTVSGTNTAVVTIKGKLTDCSGGNVTNGYALITIDNMVRYAAADANGNFEVSFIKCSGASATAQIIAVDQATQQQSLSTTSVPVTAPLTNAGSISACGTSSAQFINYTLDGTNYTLSSSVPDSLTAYYGSQGTTNNYVYIMGNSNPGTGNHSIYFSVLNPSSGGGPMAQLNVENLYPNTTPAINVTFTSYANAAGQFYEGSFNGSFTDSSMTHSISSQFRVRRNF